MIFIFLGLLAAIVPFAIKPYAGTFYVFWRLVFWPVAAALLTLGVLEVIR